MGEFSRENPQQRGLAGSVDANDTYPVALIYGKADLIQDYIRSDVYKRQSLHHYQGLRFRIHLPVP